MSGTASFLLYDTEGTTNVQYGDFYVNDPDELERIMTDVQEMAGVDWESCTLTRYDNDYQNAKDSLEGLQNIVFIAITVVSVICFLVLALSLIHIFTQCFSCLAASKHCAGYKYRLYQAEAAFKNE